MTSKHESPMKESSSYSIGDVISSLSSRAPLATAEDWDNVGLLLGDPAQKVSGVLVSIDLTEESIRTAKEKGCNLIINHHPCIFPKDRGLSRLNPGSLVYEAIRNEIAVAAYHTNFDLCALEVSQAICEFLGIKPKGRLVEKGRKNLTKLVVNVPLAHVESVRTAICEAGAGHIGNYDLATFGVQGEGTFRGGALSQPFIGKPGVLEKVQEVRLETVFPQGYRDEILKALRKSHPYEEIAYDLYSVQQAAGSTGLVSGLGYGFWGEFTEGKAFSDVGKDVKNLFNINGFWITNSVPSVVKRVGFVAGKGAAFVDAAADLGCDLFITGEAGYHTALAGTRRGMAVMELGHRESEKFFVETMKKWISKLDLLCVDVQTPTQQIWLGGTK